MTQKARYPVPLPPPTDRCPSSSRVRRDIIGFIMSTPMGEASENEVFDFIAVTNDWSKGTFPSTASEVSYLMSVYKALIYEGTISPYIDTSHKGSSAHRVRIDPLRSILLNVNHAL